jgi:hypothetical protein
MSDFPEGAGKDFPSWRRCRRYMVVRAGGTVFPAGARIEERLLLNRSGGQAEAP